MGVRRRAWDSLGMLNISKNVIEQWDLEIFGLQPKDKVVLLETRSGPKCLKVLQKSIQDVHSLFLILEHLASRGFKSVPRFIRTRYGKPYAKTDDNKFYCISDWIDGSPPDWENQIDIFLVTEKLAKLHLASHDFTVSQEERITFVNWQQRFQWMTQKMVGINLEISQENYVKKFFRDMIERALLSCRLLKDSGYRVIKEKAEQKKGFCHGAFNEHHIIMGNRGKVFVTGFDEWCRDIRLTDLAKFILLVANKNQWSPQIVQSIIESYDRVYHLYPAEWEIVCAYLRFPFNYWEVLKELAKREAEINEAIRMFEMCWKKEALKEQCLMHLGC
ncbi:MAG: CotS family spore coat protein [Bacillota bacterium]|nr:CotS family spore coat protein [Clostridia bacterium]